MLQLIIKLLLPLGSARRSLPFLSVLLILSVGIGIFLSVQSLFSNYYNDLISKVTESREEITIIKNPMKMEVNIENEEEAFFNDDDEDDGSLAGRILLRDSDINEVNYAIKKGDSLIVEPIIRIPDFDFYLGKGNEKVKLCGLFIGIEKIKDNNVFPFLDSLPPATSELFNQESPSAVPLLISEMTMPDVKLGDRLTLEHNGKTKDYVISGIISQNNLFSFPLFVMPLNIAHEVAKENRVSAIAIRTTGKESSLSVKEKIKKTLGDKFIVTHWSESLPLIKNLFKSINTMISTIVFSLFIIAFFFSMATFDILIKRHQKHLALLLALGMQPSDIKHGLLAVGSILGVCGLIMGTVVAFFILAFIPYTPLHAVLKIMYLDDLHFSFIPQAYVLVSCMALLVTVGSAWVSSKRVYKIEPIEDLRK